MQLAPFFSKGCLFKIRQGAGLNQIIKTEGTLTCVHRLKLLFYYLNFKDLKHLVMLNNNLKLKFYNKNTVKKYKLYS